MISCSYLEDCVEVEEVEPEVELVKVFAARDDSESEV